MAHARQILGRAAEEAAAGCLARAGLRIVERNVRFAHGEIDLVCRDGDVWVFVEVKCRRRGWDDGPGAAVSPAKQRRLLRLAEHYLKSRRLDGQRCRFDVVAVTVDTRAGAPGSLAVRHIPAAFDAS